jgi:23S rRNA-/tRNA-specific pseudouridylate synthase
LNNIKHGFFWIPYFFGYLGSSFKVSFSSSLSLLSLLSLLYSLLYSTLLYSTLLSTLLSLFQRHLQSKLASRAASDYVTINGFRHVIPYVYTWRTVAKGRWINQEVLELLSGEFARYPREYFINALEAGTVLLDGRKALPNDLLRNKSVLEHTAHRHEPPIVQTLLSTPKRYQYPTNSKSNNEIDFLLAIDKPASWPVHPTGGYRKNSLVHIMENELGFVFGSGGGEGEGGSVVSEVHVSGDEDGGVLKRNSSKESSRIQGGSGSGSGSGRSGLRMLYRLDRLTSGLILFANTHTSCSAFLKRLQATDDRNGQDIVKEKVVQEKDTTIGVNSINNLSSILNTDSSLSRSHHPFLDGVKKIYLVRTMGRFSTNEISKLFLNDKDVSQNGTFSSWTSFRRLYLGMIQSEKVGTISASSSFTSSSINNTHLEIFTPSVLRVRHPICPMLTKRGRYYSGPSARNFIQTIQETIEEQSIKDSLESVKYMSRKAIGKESATDFIPVAYDKASDTTLVVAIPHTGRNHQIRVHLNGLGHSIVDDPVYGGRESIIRSYCAK